MNEKQNNEKEIITYGQMFFSIRTMLKKYVTGEYELEEFDFAQRTSKALDLIERCYRDNNKSYKKANYNLATYAKWLMKEIRIIRKTKYDTYEWEIEIKHPVHDWYFKNTSAFQSDMNYLVSKLLMAIEGRLNLYEETKLDKKEQIVEIVL